MQRLTRYTLLINAIAKKTTSAIDKESLEAIVSFPCTIVNTKLDHFFKDKKKQPFLILFRVPHCMIALLEKKISCFNEKHQSLASLLKYPLYNKDLWHLVHTDLHLGL